MATTIRENKKDNENTTSPVWDISQERAFMETLTNQRLNFFLIIITIVGAGAVNSKNELFLRIILGAGTVLSFLLALTIQRANHKLDLIFRRLKKNHPEHPYTIIDNEAGKGSVRWIIGCIIPFGCFLFLLVLFVLSFSCNMSLPTTK